MPRSPAAHTVPFLHLCSLHIPRERHHRLAGFRLHACAQHMMHNTVLLLHCPPSATPDTFSAMSFLHFFFKCIAPPHRQSTTLLWVHLHLLVVDGEQHRQLRHDLEPVLFSPPLPQMAVKKKMRKSAMFFSLSGTVTDLHLRPRRDEHAEP